MIDDSPSGQYSGATGQYHDKNQHQAYGSFSTVSAISATEEKLADTFDGLRNAPHGAIGIMNLSISVPGGNAHTGEVTPAPSLHKRINPNHESREQQTRNNNDVTQGKSRLNGIGGKKWSNIPAGIRLDQCELTKINADQKYKNITPGKTASGHHGTHPGHQTLKAADLFGFDPN